MEKICDGIMKRNSGFTLIEQLIVIAIIVSLLGFGAIQMTQVYKQNSVETATNNLKTVLQFLQMKSIEDGLVYELALSEDGKKIQVKREVHGKKDFELFRSSWITAVQMGHSIQLAFERSGDLFFYPDGMTSKNRLFLVKEGGARVSLALKNRIGTIEIKNV